MAAPLLTVAAAGLRRGRLEAALTGLVVLAAAAALTVALGVGRVADRPWERTFDATNGAHVVAMSLDAAADLSPLEQLPGVAGSTGVRPVAISSFRLDGKTYGLRLIGADGDSAVARPLVQSGGWVEPGGVVLERSFAEFLGLRPGDVLRTPSTALRVTGIAVVSQAQGYPASQPGIGFALADTIATVVPDRSRWGSLLGLRLADPDASGAFVASAQGAGYQLDDWQDQRTEAVDASRTAQVILSVFGVLLLLAGGAVIATLVGGRILADVRRLGLLKAAGLTPRQVTGVVLLEQLAPALAGAVLGVLVGVAATPLFVARSAALLATSETPPFDPRDVALVLALTLGAVAAFALGPSRRAAHTSVALLLAGPQPSRRRSRLAELAERLGLPVPVTLGARDSFAHPGRAALTALSLALTVGAVVATLSMEASLAVVPPPLPQPAAAAQSLGPLPARDPVDDDADEAAQLRPIVYTLDAVLLFVALTNLVATILLSLRERARNLALLRAAGLTPGQVTTSFLTSQAGVAIVSALAGIPLGLAVFRGSIQLTGSTDEFAYPRALWLVLLAPASVALILAVSAPLARRAVRRSVGDALRYE